MLQPHGWRYVELSNEGSLSCAEEKITMLSRAEFGEFYPRQGPKDFVGSYAVIGERGWPTFNARLFSALSAHAKPGDIVCHPFGRAHQGIVTQFPHLQHFESGIGYCDAPFGCWRAFETNQWRSWHWGRWESDPALAKDKGMNRLYSWVIHNSWDLRDWDYRGPEENEDYVVYLGRLTPLKGMTTIAEVIRENARQAQLGLAKRLKFVFAGSGDFEKEVMVHVLRDPAPDHRFLDIEYRGPVTGRARSELIGKARVMLAPTEFIEPQNGSHIEAMLCGTPSVTVPFGAFGETITPGKNGFHAHTLGDWMAMIRAAKGLDRKQIADDARAKYSLEATGKLYDAALWQIADLSGAGWYHGQSRHLTSLTPVSVPSVPAPNP